MRSQGFASPCGYGFSGTRLSIQQHAALGASRQELVHSSRVVKLYMAVPRHASTSGTRSSRARVRPRSEHAAGTQRRTVLLPVGASGALPSFLDTRLASSVMAGDDHMEQLSLVQQRGMAATRAAVRSHGHGTSNGSLGGKGGRAGKHERRHQQRAQRGGERGRSSSGAATVSSPATATHQEEGNGAPSAADAGRDVEQEEAAAVKAKTEADAVLVTVRQKAFLKRVVELGLRRRPTEVLHLMEDVKTEGFPPFNIYMYNACITALARCGRWRQALAVLVYMRHTANAVEAAAALEAKKANSDDAEDVPAKSPAPHTVVRPDVFSYSAAITACGNCGEWRRALALLRVMREQGVPPNVVSYNAAAHACVGDRRNSGESRADDDDDDDDAKPPGSEEEGWVLVLGLMAEMRAEGVAPDAFTFTTAITACGKAGQWERALGLLEEMGGAGQPQAQEEGGQRSTFGIAPNVAAINAAISACARAGRAERALGLLNRMATRDGRKLVGSIRIGGGIDGQDKGSSDSSTPRTEAPEEGPAWPAADSVSFNSAMEACAVSGRWQEGATLLSRMREAGVRPDVCSYGAHLACLRAGGQWRRALEVLEEMRAGGAEVNGGAGVRPDLGCYAVVMSTLGEAGRWEQALELLRFLQKQGAAGVAAGAGAAGWDAERLVAEASGGGAAISSSPAAGPNLVCYNAALTACARAREGPAALNLLEEMEARGIFDTASFNCAMLACRGMGQWQKATAILERMINGEAARRGGDGEDGDGVNGFAGAPAPAAAAAAAAAAGAPRGVRPRATVPRPNAYSFSACITACGDVGQADVAVGLLRRMPAAGVAPNVVVFNAVIRAVSRGINGPASGVSAVREGWSWADGGFPAARIHPDAELGGGGGSGGNSWRRAYGLLVEMRELGLVPEVKSYNSILAVCQRAEAWEGAVEVLEEMKRGKTKRPIGLNPSRRAANADDATSRWVEEPVPPPDVCSFNTAMGACGKAGQWEEALRLLSELSEFGLSPDATSYNTAAAACARAEKWDRAAEIINRGREVGVLEDARDGEEQRGAEKGGGGRGVVVQKDMSSFHATVEDMAGRRKRGAQRREGGSTLRNDSTGTTGNCSSNSSGGGGSSRDM